MPAGLRIAFVLVWITAVTVTTLRGGAPDPDASAAGPVRNALQRQSLGRAQLIRPPRLGDPRTLDPCALVRDTTLLDRLGDVLVSRDGGLNSCLFRIDTHWTQGSQPPTEGVLVSVDRADRVRTPPGGTVHRRGTVTIRGGPVTHGPPWRRDPPGHGDPEAADRTTQRTLSWRGGAYAVVVQVTNDGFDEQEGVTSADIRRVADATATTAAIALTSGPQPRWTGRPALAALDACTMVDPEVLVGAGLGRAEPGYAHWSCHWPAATGSLSLTVTFGALDNDDADTPWDRYRARQAPGRGHPLLLRGSGPRRCEVQLAGPSHAWTAGYDELVDLVVDDRAGRAGCPEALRVAKAIAPRVPGR